VIARQLGDGLDTGFIILKNLFEESMFWAKALYITAIELETILEDRIPFPTLEGCIGQINALDALFKNAPSTLPLHLIPIFFKNDCKFLLNLECPQELIY
jgi:hypothetical protein